MNKVPLIALLLLGIIYLSSGCKRTYYKLTITLDSTFNYNRLLDSVNLSSKSFDKTFNPNDTTSWSYDFKNKRTSIYWDSLTSNEYVLNIKTIFSKSQISKFSLISDSNIFIKNNLGFVVVDIIDKNELTKMDTIEIVYNSDGCFHCYIEKSTLIKDKKDNKYFEKTISNDKPLVIDKIVPSEIIDSIFLVEFESKKLKDSLKKSRTFFGISTTTQRLYILAKNKVFQFNDQGLDHWKLYEKIK
jgi:hypothetical protein